MEANTKEALQPVVDHEGSYHRGVSFNSTFGSSFNNFDNFLQIDQSEFDALNLPTLDSLELTSSTIVTDSIERGHSSLRKKRGMPYEKLAELARVDPKQAKRILAKRMSAAKSKEKKKQYENELREKVQMCKIEVDNNSEQLATYQACVFIFHLDLYQDINML
ncbi:hypothetical protein RIF29_39085 [Crotalaria pallida]|uniref:Uncharacterized protein n=1 Tax=Crotalaria pallida TaxID=3830 RepID=A0AAN9E1E6_CROPI